jgi:hypothetical protein
VRGDWIGLDGLGWNGKVEWDGKGRVWFAIKEADEAMEL